MPDTAVASKQRAVASDLTIQLGLMTLIVDAVPVRRPNLSKSGFSLRCPQCATPARVHQAYSCEDKHGPFREDQLGHGRDVDGTFVSVTDDEYTAAMGAAVPKGECTLSVYPADQVGALTRPDESAYRLRPTKGTSAKAYGVLLAAASDPRYALVGEINLRGSQKPYQLTVWRGMLVVQSIVRPSDLAEPEGVQAEMPDAKVSKQLESLLEAELVDFDVETFRNQRAERLAALDEAKRLGSTETVVPVVVPVRPEADILSLLTASVSAAKAARKPAAKKPTAKPAVARTRKATAA